MKILSLNTATNAAASGGAERIIESMMRMFKANGEHVAVLGTCAEPGLHRIDQAGITQWRAGIRNVYWPRMDEARSWPMRRLWHLRDIYNRAMQQPLGQVLDAERPDVVFVHNLPGWSIAAIALIRERQIPVIQILHDYYNICANSTMSRGGRNCAAPCLSCRALRLPHRQITSQVNAVVGVSDYILERHLECGAFADVPIKRVINNVRSAASLGLAEAPMLRRQASARRDAGTTRFGFIGSITKEKGIEMLLEAFAGWDDPATELWVAGVGKPEDVNRLIARHAGPRVTFLGSVEPKHFFTAIDVSIVPSLWQEPFAGVAAESLAFGVPVIAARRGGLEDIVAHGRNGLVFEPDEPGALTAAMMRCAAAPELIQQMAKKAQDDAARFLDTAQWNNAYTQLIEEVKTAVGATTPVNLFGRPASGMRAALVSPKSP
jgi:glycosyltransferase involved in cell wall biosynthesis